VPAAGLLQPWEHPRAVLAPAADQRRSSPSAGSPLRGSGALVWLAGSSPGRTIRGGGCTSSGQLGEAKEGWQPKLDMERST